MARIGRWTPLAEAIKRFDSRGDDEDNNDDGDGDIIRRISASRTCGEFVDFYDISTFFDGVTAAKLCEWQRRLTHEMHETDCFLVSQLPGFFHVGRADVYVSWRKRVLPCSVPPIVNPRGYTLPSITEAIVTRRPYQHPVFASLSGNWLTDADASNLTKFVEALPPGSVLDLSANALAFATPDSQVFLRAALSRLLYVDITSSLPTSSSSSSSSSLSPLILASLLCSTPLCLPSDWRTKLVFYAEYAAYAAFSEDAISFHAHAGYYALRRVVGAHAVVM